MFITPAFEQATGAGAGGTDLILQVVPFALIFVIMYFLILVKNVRRGDTVVPSGGILGRVSKVTDDAAEIEVEIAEGVRVKVVRAMITEVRAKGEPVKAA